MRKKNCWEAKKCGREAGGTKVKEMGTCPVSVDRRLHGVHDGDCAGRACWIVAGSYCGGKEQGTFAQKYKNCEVCDFYLLVRKEEGPNFVYSAVLLNKIRKK